MGQATVSPDPLDESATVTTTIASADDLLAQLAGEEIDRLLAESEAERATAEERAGVAVAPVVAAGLGRGVSADANVTPIVEPAGTVAPPVVPPLAPQVPTPPEPAAPVVPAPGVVRARVEKHDIDVDPDAVGERAALIDEALAPVPAAAHDGTVIVADDAGPLPIYLRPLEWLNAPLASCPERLRETLGKVAIVTLVNAVAVLAYVLMFRRQ